jgi:enoyl-CoA hydratase
MADQDAVLTEAEEGILLITLNRPDQRNAVNQAVAQGVADALERLDDDPELRAAILTGAGKGFCAGMDLKGFAAGERPWIEGRGFAGIVRRPPSKPIIAAVEGFAVAGGFEVALACDLIVASKGAKLGVPEVKRGLVAAGGGLLRLPHRVPHHVAMEMALTGDPITAERAYEIGLVNRVTEPGEALAGARELAAAVVPNAPLSLVATKQIIEGSKDWPQAQMWEEQEKISGPVFDSEDAREGAVAFAEKREPDWKGR